MGPKHDTKVISNTGKFISLSPLSIFFPCLNMVNKVQRTENQKVLFCLLLQHYLFFSSFSRDLISSFIVAVKFCPQWHSGTVDVAQSHPLGPPLDLHLSEVDGSSATAPPIHSIFPDSQNFYLVWLFFSPINEKPLIKPY